MYICAALYKFVELNDFESLREPLYQVMLENDVKGTLLLAREGINGTICGTRQGIDNVLAHINADERLAGIEHKESLDEQAFYRTKVKLKRNCHHGRRLGGSEKHRGHLCRARKVERPYLRSRSAFN